MPASEESEALRFDSIEECIESIRMFLSATHSSSYFLLFLKCHMSAAHSTSCFRLRFPQFKLPRILGPVDASHFLNMIKKI